MQLNLDILLAQGKITSAEYREFAVIAKALPPKTG
jgi:hypothetical protein